MKTDIHGNTYASRLRSYIVWRKVTKNFRSVYKKTGTDFPTKRQVIEAYAESEDASTCVICDGTNFLMLKDERVYCLCELMNHYHVVESRVGHLRSRADNRTMEEMIDWGGKDATDSLKLARDFAYEFVVDPRRWLVLAGVPGCGKTHIMQSVARLFGPFALYISSEDFEQKLFEAMGAGVLDDMMFALTRTPILLFDDWGTEHGKDFFLSKFRQLITFRYNHWPEYPVFLTSNMGKKTMYKQDHRAASRLQDHEKSRFFIIKAGDYRLKGAF